MNNSMKFLYSNAYPTILIEQKLYLKKTAVSYVADTQIKPCNTGTTKVKQVQMYIDHHTIILNNLVRVEENL
jgi:hypothetical protein